MKATTISELFLGWCNFNGDLPITNLKLQKLLYYAQGWCFADLGKELFEDEIEAWKYGPVIRSTYEKYKNFKNLPICIDVDTDSIEKKFDEKTLKFLKDFYNMYIDIPAHELVASSHQEKPWFITFNTEGENKTIKKELIKDFFINWSRSEKD